MENIKKYLQFENGKVVVYGILENDKRIVIPSQQYPISGEPELFHNKNTEQCADQQVIEIFDSIKAEIGHCYHNIETFMKALEAAGIDKTLYRPYGGWLFINDEVPVHHEWLVYKNVHIFDFSSSNLFFNSGLENIDDKDVLYEKVIDLYMHQREKANHEWMTCGHADEYSVYVGSVCKPSDAIKLYRKLVKAFPKHPCIGRVNKDTGVTEIQTRILKRIHDEQKRR